MMKNILISIFIISLFLFGWEIASLSSDTLNFLLPPPSRIFLTFIDNFHSLLFHAFATFKEMSAGFFLALLIAFPVAWLMASFAPVRNILQPVFITIQCIPMFALAPLLVLWFGWSFLAISIATALMVFFPLTMNVYLGFSNTPKPYTEYFKINRATASQMFFKLQLPWALPQIFAGFRISVALAGIGAVAGEWAGAQSGLGVLMMESRRAADLDLMFAALCSLVIMSLTLYGLALLFEKAIISKFASKVSLVLLAISLIGCSQHQDQESQNEVKLVLDWLPNPNHVPIYVGVEKGFFKEQGINLRVIKTPDQSDSIPYLVSQQADIALSYMPHTILAMRNRAPVKPIGKLMESPLNGIIFPKSDKIHFIADLNGKVIGYSPDGFGTRFLQSMLHDKNIVPSEYLNVAFDLVTTLKTGQVDALFGAYWNIESENLRALGLETDYFSITEFGVPSYYELIFLSRSEAGSFEAFQKAMQKSIDFALSNPDEAFQIYLSANPDKSRMTREWEYYAWKNTIPYLAKDQMIDANVWNAFVEWLKSHDLF